MLANVRRQDDARDLEQAAGGGGGRRAQGDVFAVFGDLDLLEAIEVAQRSASSFCKTS